MAVTGPDAPSPDLRDQIAATFEAWFCTKAAALRAADAVLPVVTAAITAARREYDRQEVLVEDSWFARGDLPKILGNFMRAADRNGLAAKAAEVKLCEIRDLIHDQTKVRTAPIRGILAGPLAAAVQPAAGPQRCPTYDPATDECSCWASAPAPGPGDTTPIAECCPLLPVLGLHSFGCEAPQCEWDAPNHREVGCQRPTGHDGNHIGLLTVEWAQRQTAVCGVWHDMYGACELPYRHEGPHARLPGGSTEPNTWTSAHALDIRCPSCEHAASWHSEGGCWFVVVSARPGVVANCACSLETPGDDTAGQPATPAAGVNATSEAMDGHDGHPTRPSRTSAGSGTTPCDWCDEHTPGARCVCPGPCTAPWCDAEAEAEAAI